MSDMRERIVDAIAEGSDEFTDAFLNAWVIGGFPRARPGLSYSEDIACDERLRKLFRKSMAAAVETIKGDAK